LAQTQRDTSSAPFGYTLQFVRNVEIHDDGHDVLLTAPTGTLRLTRPGRELRMALEHLARGVDRDALGQVAESAGTPDTAAQLSLALALARIERNGFVRYTVADSRGSIATLEPVAPGCFLDNPVLPGRCLLSRFACLRRVHDALIIESPLGHARVVLHG